MIPAEDDLSSLRTEVRQLRMTVSCFSLVLMLALALVNLSSLLKIPQSEKIFEDMLGSRDKLPELTKLVLNYFRFGGGSPSLLLVLVPTLVLCPLMFLSRSPWFRYVLPTIWSVCLAIHLVVVMMAMQLPMMTIIQGINEKSP